MKCTNALVAFGLTAILLSASGCANETKGHGQLSGPGSVAAASSPDDQAIIKADEFLGANGPSEQGRQIVIQKCMNAAGFDWDESEVRRFQVEDLISLKPLTVEQARSNGYAQTQQSAGKENDASEPGAAEAFAGPSNASRVSVDIFGMKPSVSSEGCLAESYKEVYGSIEKGMMATGVTTNALLPSVNAAITDTAVLDADKAWSACMEQAGIPDLSSPDLAWKKAKDNSQEAGSIAVSDAKCRESVGYEKARTASLNKYLTTFLRTNETLITEIQEIRRQGAANAQKILSGL